MTLADLTLLEFVAFLTLFPCSYLLFKLVTFFKKPYAEEEVEKLFHLFWDETPEDKLYAWYKVRYILSQRENNRQKISLVNRKIDEVDQKDLCGNMLINASGELVDKRETGSKIL